MAEIAQAVALTTSTFASRRAGPRRQSLRTAKEYCFKKTAADGAFRRMIAARARAHRGGLEAAEPCRRRSLYAAEGVRVESATRKSAAPRQRMLSGSRIPRWRCRSSTTKANSCASVKEKTCRVISLNGTGCSHSRRENETRPGVRR